MLNGKYVSLATVAEKVYRDYGFNEDVDWADMVEWAGDAIDLIRIPMQYFQKTTDGVDTPMIEIVNGRGALPCDLVHIIQTSTCDGTPLRYSTDSFHFKKYTTNGCADVGCLSGTTYKLNDNYIFPSFQTGRIVMAYLAFPTDSDGIPLVPEDMAIQQAVKAYLGERVAFRMFIKGSISGQVYQKINQERDWYIGKAQTSSLVPNKDKTESIKNQWRRLVSFDDAHSNGYQSMSSQQVIKNHAGYR